MPEYAIRGGKQAKEKVYPMPEEKVGSIKKLII